MNQEFLTALTAAAAGQNIELPPAAVELLARYYEFITAKNEQINLTAITDPADFAVKNIVDSLACWDEELCPAAGRLIDVGTGAGLPGIPLRLLHPELKVTLLDSLAKRLNVLAEFAAQIGLAEPAAKKLPAAQNPTYIRFLHARAEDAGRDIAHRGRYDIVTARAVAPLNVLAEYLLPLARRDGLVVVLKGAKYRDELAAAKRALGQLKGEIIKVKEVSLPGAEKHAVIYIRARGVPAAYPRKAGLPAKKPL